MQTTEKMIIFCKVELEPKPKTSGSWVIILALLGIPGGCIGLVGGSVIVLNGFVMFPCRVTVVILWLFEVLLRSFKLALGGSCDVTGFRGDSRFILVFVPCLSGVVLFIICSSEVVLGCSVGFESHSKGGCRATLVVVQ